MAGIWNRIKKISRRFWLRVLIVVISVGISSLYTNEKNRRLEIDKAALSVKITELENRNENLMQEQSRIRNNLLLLSLAEDNYPSPKWMKSVDYMMLKLNKSYENLYLKPLGLERNDYIGHYDYDIWPEGFANRFRENDSLVLTAGEPITFMEPIPDGVGNVKLYEVTKYPIRVNGVVIGIGGYVDINYSVGE